MKKIVTITLIVILGFMGGRLLRQHRERTSLRALAELLPQITTITLYDISDRIADSNTLAAAISTPFPVEVFRRAGASATNKGGVVIWKGSALGVLTLRDESQRRVYLSYYGSFFTVEGLSGHFVVPGGSESEFQRTCIQLIQEQFFPKRRERNKARDG